MTKMSQAVFPALALCLLGGAVLLTLAFISPPAPLPADAPATKFSAGRAMQDLEIIAKEPHPMGEFPAHAAVRDFLLGEIRKLGLEPQVQKTIGVRVVNSGSALGGAVENILTRLPGTNPEGAILLMAHYDSTPGGPGGVDSGSAVVTILELLRALHAGPALRQDVIFLFTDGEEPGTFGAHAFVAQHPWFHDVGLVINMDQFGKGLILLVHTSQGNGLWVQALARTATRPAFISLPVDLFPGGETDFVPFARAGIRGADIQTIVRFAENHTSLDRPELVDQACLQQAGDQLLALTHYLGDQPALEISVPDQTYFPVFGKLVHYPTSWAWPSVILAGSCFLGTMIYGFRKRELTWRGLGVGSLAFLFSLALSVGIANLLWLGIQALHPEYSYSSDRTHLSDDSLYAVGFFILALAISTASIALARKKIAALDLAAGALVIWFPGSIAAAALVPATSYLVTWVLLSSSLALLLALAIQAKKGAWVLSGLGFLTSAILATFLWIPVIYAAFLVPGFPLLSMMMGLAAIWLGAMLPILDWITGLKRWPLPAATLLAALGLLLTGHFLVGKDSPPPPVNPIGYWLDANDGNAYWVTFSQKLDKRQSNLLMDAVRRPYAELFPEALPLSVLTSEAPMLTLAGPRLEVIMDEWANSRRVVNIRFTTSMHDRLYIVVQDAPLVAITVPNNERAELAGSNERWLRFDGMPVEGMEIRFEFSTSRPIRFLLVEEKTGLPSFPGLLTQPEPGTMQSPGEFLQSIPTDFTAMYRSFVVPAYANE
jgi:hypothetical protein